jgi:Tol biopolymer transport system component
MKQNARALAVSLVACSVFTACANATPTLAPSTQTPGATKVPVPVTLAATPTLESSQSQIENTAAPTIENTTAPTSTPQPTVTFAQLTGGGCCVQPFLSADGARVLFIDKPSPNAPTGVWAVNASATPGLPQLFSEVLGPFSRDLAYAADLVNGRTVIRHLEDGAEYVINNGGRAVSFSPDATRILWTVQQEVGGFDVRRTDVYVADIDGANARLVTTRFGGGALAWLPDSQRVLIGGRANRADDLPTLAILTLADGSVRNLIPVERLRNSVLSPDGRYLIYFVGQARDPARNGTYLLDLAADNPQPQTMDFFGAYRWRDANRLLFVPLEPGALGNALWQLDVVTMTKTQLIAPDAASPFKIANGDWDVARDGSKLIFLSARDRNIWMATLP